MTVAEEDSLLLNEDDPENCSSSGSPCGSIEDVWEKSLLSDLQLSLLSSSSSLATILNFLFDFLWVPRLVWWMNLRNHFPLLNIMFNQHHQHHFIWLLQSLMLDLHQYLNPPMSTDLEWKSLHHVQYYVLQESLNYLPIELHQSFQHHLE